MTYLQIYNEALYDMLAEEGGGAPAELLRIRQDPQRGVFVQGLSEHEVRTPQQVPYLAYISPISPLYLA